MPHNLLDGNVVVIEQALADGYQRLVLLVTIANLVTAFQFDADRKVITSGAATMARLARMPRASIERHELHETAITPDQQVAGDLHTGEISKIRVAIAIKPAGKERLDVRPAEMACRQTDAVDDDKLDRAVGRPVVAPAFCLANALESMR